jgi:hypothetical protein
MSKEYTYTYTYKTNNEYSHSTESFIFVKKIWINKRCILKGQKLEFVKIHGEWMMNTLKGRKEIYCEVLPKCLRISAD